MILCRDLFIPTFYDTFFQDLPPTPGPEPLWHKIFHKDLFEKWWLKSWLMIFLRLNCWWCGVFTWFVEDMGGYGDVRIGPPGVCRYLVGKGAESRSRSGSVAMVWIHSRFCDSSVPWTKWEQIQCQPPVSSTPLLESNSWCIFLREWLTILTHACVILDEVIKLFLYV